MLLPSRLTSLPVLSLRSHNWPLIPPQRRHTTCATRQHANQRIGAHLDKNKADIVDQIRRVNLRFDGLEQNFETLFEAFLILFLWITMDKPVVLQKMYNYLEKDDILSFLQIVVYFL